MASPDRAEIRDRRENTVLPNTKTSNTRDHRGSAPAEISVGMDCEAPTCRICYHRKATGQGPLIAPCSCRGLIGFAHKRCLETWLREKDTNQCDVCLQRISVRNKPMPVWYFFRDPKHRRDIVRMLVNALSCLGDVMVLSFAWTYASGFLGSVGWLTYLFILGVLLFQTVFWMMVEVIRIVACYQPVRKWRDETCSLDLELKRDDAAANPQSSDGPDVIVLQEKNMAANGHSPSSSAHSPKLLPEKDHVKVPTTLDRAADNWAPTTPVERHTFAESADKTTDTKRPKPSLRIAQ